MTNFLKNFAFQFPRFSMFLFVLCMSLSWYIHWFLGTEISLHLDLYEWSIVLIMLVSMVYTVLNQPIRKKYGRYLPKFSAIALAGAMLCFGLGNLTQTPEGNALATVTTNEPKDFETFKKEQKAFTKIEKKTSKTKGSNGGRRFGYVMLFLLSLTLTYLGLALSCTLSCNGMMFFAILALLATLGVFSGGIYFLLKTFRKTLPEKGSDKRAEWIKYLKTFGSIVVILAITILIINIVNA